MARHPLAETPGGKAVPGVPLAETPGGKAVPGVPLAETPGGKAVPGVPLAETPGGVVFLTASLSRRTLCKEIIQYLHTMPIRTTIPYTFGTFFITFTNFRWKNLIGEIGGYDIVYRWFDYLKKQGNFVHGYVIMPNHIHVMISFAETGTNINTTIGNGKRFVAYEIVKRLSAANKTALLETLSSAVCINRREKNQKHSVWEPSFDWKYCYGSEFLLQKLDYIHANPCRGKWKLCNDPVEYPYNSAGFYMVGKQGLYPVTHIGDLEDIELTRG